MLSIQDCPRERLQELVSWMEAPIALEVVMPTLQKHLNELVSRLLASKDDDDIIRGQVKAINEFIGLHDYAIAASNDKE